MIYLNNNEEKNYDIKGGRYCDWADDPANFFVRIASPPKLNKIEGGKKGHSPLQNNIKISEDDYINERT